MKKYYTQMLTVCCAIVFGAFITTDALAQGSTCETAVVITPGAFTADGPSDGVSEDPCLTGAGAFADWYSYTPTEDGTIAVSSCEGGADTQLQILEGTCGALSCVASEDDVCAVTAGGSNFAAELTDISVLAGTTYYIEWDNQWEDLGFDWTLSFTAAPEFDCEGVAGGSAQPGTPCDDENPETVGETFQEDCSCAGGIILPSNDLCADAESVECGSTVSGSTSSATADASLGTCITPLISAPGVWYSIVGDGSEITASLCNEATSFDTKIGIFSGDCGALVCETGNDDSCGLRSEATFASVDGQTYYIYVTGFGTASGDFDLSVSCASTVEDCEGVIGGPALPGTPCDDSNPETEGETYQEDCSCAGGIIPVPNDECDSSTPLVCGGSVDGTTDGATALSDLNDECNDFTSASAEDVWYSFEADGSSSYTVTVDTNAATSSSLMDAVIFVYSGACGDLTEIGCADENFTAFSGETFTLDAPEAGTYYVRVFNWNTGGEVFTISLDCESSCADPFPAVNEESLTTTNQGNIYIVAWEPVEGQIGCQLQLRTAAGELVNKKTVLGEDVSSQVITGAPNLEFNTDYIWRVRCGCSIEPLVAGPWSPWQEFTTPGSAISSLPNPTEGQSNVTFTVVEEGYTTLEVFDMSGRLVDAIFTGNAQPNSDYRFEFDGSALPNGVYIYRLTTESEVLNEKFMIIR